MSAKEEPARGGARSRPIESRICIVPATPAPGQPGTLGEQLAAIDAYLATPWRHRDRAAAWELARRLCIPHARRGRAG